MWPKAWASTCDRRAVSRRDANAMGRQAARLNNYCHLLGYSLHLEHMILGFRHRGLQRLYEKGDRRRIPPSFVEKIEDILNRLDVATYPRNLDLPGYRLHRLIGDMAGYWSIVVSSNWRIIFRFDDSDVIDVDLIDYH